MTAETWLLEHISGAPDRLALAMVEAVGPDARGDIPHCLAEAAVRLYGKVLDAGHGRDAALPLLAADALLTHAFEAQAELDPEGLDAFAREYATAEHLATLLT